jgi:hypothetical protein
LNHKNPSSLAALTTLESKVFNRLVVHIDSSLLAYSLDIPRKDWLSVKLSKRYWVHQLKGLGTIIMSFSADTFIQGDDPYVRDFLWLSRHFLMIRAIPSDIRIEATAWDNDDFACFRGYEFSRAIHATSTYTCLGSSKF